jgi:S-adenosylmethionine-dependent methyltransferase
MRALGGIPNSVVNTNLDRIRTYYSHFREWERLDTPAGALEFRRACALIRGNLPDQSLVLDLGGGPGRYAIELARLGHRVVLADLSPELLEEARRRFMEVGVGEAVASIDEVSATNLEIYGDRSFDAVVAFGPFYHLLAEQERESAAREIFRVLRPSGIGFISFVPRQSGLSGLLERAAQSPEQVPVGVLRRAASTGIFQNGADSGFQEGYYPTVNEISKLFESRGFAIREVISLRELADMREAAFASLTDEVRSEAERMLDQFARDPEVVAMGGHAVLVVSKPET